LPLRVDGGFAVLHRPLPMDGAHIRLSLSPDLRHWGQPRQVLRARLGWWWDAGKIGLAAPPIETSQGWLTLCHGVRRTVAGCIYRVGLALLALEDPKRCLLRGDPWVFGPETGYARGGNSWSTIPDPDRHPRRPPAGTAECTRPGRPDPLGLGW